MIDENELALSAVGVKNYPLWADLSEGIDFAKDLIWLKNAASGKYAGVEVVYAPMHPDHKGVVDDIFTHHQKSVVVDSEKAYVLGQNFRDVDWDVSEPHSCIKKMAKGFKRLMNVGQISYLDAMSAMHQRFTCGSGRFMPSFLPFGKAFRAPNPALSRVRSKVLRLHP